MSIHETESSHDTNDENKSLTPLSNESNEMIKKQCHYCEKTILENNLWRYIEEVQTKINITLLLLE